MMNNLSHYQAQQSNGFMPVDDFYFCNADPSFDYVIILCEHELTSHTFADHLTGTFCYDDGVLRMNSTMKCTSSTYVE